MSESPTKVLIISRNLLLRAQESSQSSAIFRLLAQLTRKGYHLLLTASEPDQWLPTRGSVDNALAWQGDLQREISVAGGDLDGVYYVPRSLFTQDRSREGALKDILKRYLVSADQAMLFSSSNPFIKAANRLKIRTVRLSSDDDGPEAFEKALKILAEV